MYRIRIDLSTLAVPFYQEPIAQRVHVCMLIPTVVKWRVHKTPYMVSAMHLECSKPAMHNH